MAYETFNESQHLSVYSDIELNAPRQNVPFTTAPPRTHQRAYDVETLGSVLTSGLSCPAHIHVGSTCSSPVRDEDMDVSLGLEKVHVIVAGGAGHIGRVVVGAFLAAGAHVSSLDIAHPHDGHHRIASPAGLVLQQHVDITSEESVAQAFAKARQTFGPVQCLVALAAKDLSVLPHTGLLRMPVAQWLDTFNVNIGGTMMVCREYLKGLDRDKAEYRALSNLSIILVGSESGWFGERTNPDYAASKAAVQVGLLQSLKAEVPRIHPNARVNAVAPGPVDTDRFKNECMDDPNQLYADAQATVALRKPVAPRSVAKSILYLASDNFSSNVHGQVLNVDSGKQGKLMWTREEVV